ncbi:MAG TPA: response regulator [Chthonomonadaceae bacterium]|nr:response regulator [Chthonomonadaceae bacterium]
MKKQKPFSYALTDKRVVIIEDEGISQTYLSRILRQHGLIIAGQAYNGLEGVHVVLRERPDIVLMDLQMPVLNGVEAAQRILAVYPVCIVFLTAHTETFTWEQAEQVGAYGYIQKPADRITLLDSLLRAYQTFQAKIQNQKE